MTEFMSRLHVVVKEAALTKRRTPIPEKITDAGENTCKIGDKGQKKNG